MSKRMFSADIVESDAFLDMPLTAQALYMHLNMAADNDGFVNPKRILRMVGANDDDLRILIAKRFVLVFPSGVVVVKHWWINNTKRLDRHMPTTYQNELAELNIKPNKSYTEKSPQLALTTEVEDPSATNRQPHGNQMVPEAMFNRSYVHVHSNSIHSKETTNVVGETPGRPDKSSPDINALFDYWHEKVGYTVKGRVQANRRACSNLLKKYGDADVRKLINIVAAASNERYAPNIADFCQLQQDVNRLVMWAKKKSNNPEVIVL